MDSFMLAVVVLFLSIVLSRIINERANRKLDQEKKASLIDIFAKDRITSIGVLLGIIVLFFIGLKYTKIEPLTAYLIYFGVLLVFMIYSSYRSYKKLEKADFPKPYINQYLLSTAIRFLGIVLFVALAQQKL